MTRRHSRALIAALLFCACASEWRAEQPGTPITYQVPAYRTHRSVGNLRRLAVLPVRVRRVGTFSVITHSERTEAGLVHEAVSYLSSQKGYDAVPVVNESGMWRSELDDLKTAWDGARTEDEISESVRKIGQALNVDGVVSIWLEEYDGGSGIEGGLWGITNIFLLNVPLLYGLLHTNAEAVIYEVLSGRPIWRNQLSGDFERRLQGSVTTVFFENLENAIPARLAN